MSSKLSRWVFIPALLFTLVSLVSACSSPEAQNTSQTSAPLETRTQVISPPTHTPTMSAPSSTPTTMPPTQTATSIPLPSTAPTSTATPFPKPTDTVMPAGAELSETASGYTDHSLGYSITFPEGWIVIELTESDTEERMAAAAEIYPDMQDTVDLFNLQTQGFDLVSLPLDSTAAKLVTPPNVNILMTEIPPSYSLDFILQANAQLLPQIVPGIQVLSTEILSNANDLLLGIITYNFHVTNVDGDDEYVFGKIALLNLEGSLVTVTASVSESARAEYESIFDAIFDTIVLISP